MKNMNYDKVSQQITEMLLSGEKITVRNILARTGGKTATIAEYLRRWHAQNAASSVFEDNYIDEEIVTAILNYRGLAVSSAVNGHKEQITKQELLIQELSGIINRYETELKANELEINALRDKEIVHKAFSQAQDTTILELKQGISVMQEKLDVVAAEKHEAITQAAVWQTKYEQLQVAKPSLV